MKYPKLLGSSVDANRLALTVKGILVGLIPVIVVLAKAKGFDLNPGSVSIFGQQLSDAIVAIGSAVSAVMVVVGVIRKLVVYMKAYKK